MKRKETKKSQGFVKVKDRRGVEIQSLWKRGSRYYARLSLPTADGGSKSVRKPLEARDTASAVIELGALKARRKEGKLNAKDKAPTLSEWVPQYLDHLRRIGRKKGTLRAVRARLSDWTKRIGGLGLERIRRRHVIQATGDMVDDGLSGWTVNLRLDALHATLRHAARCDYLEPPLPTDGVERMKRPNRDRRLYSNEELEGLCAALERRRNGQQASDYVSLLRFSGCRKVEALSLKWDDVDFDERRLRVGAGGIAKNSQTRFVDFNPDLERHLQVMSTRRIPDADHLFPAVCGDRSQHSSGFYSTLKECCAEVGFDDFTLHGLRHLFISRAIMGGIDVRVIAFWVGHADRGALILRNYAHLTEAHRRESAMKLVFAPRIVEEEVARG